MGLRLAASWPLSRRHSVALFTACALAFALLASGGCARRDSSREAAATFIEAVATGDAATANAVSTTPLPPSGMEEERVELIGTPDAGKKASVVLKAVDRNGKWESWEVESITLDGKTTKFADQPFTSPALVWVHDSGYTYKVVGHQALMILR